MGGATWVDFYTPSNRTRSQMLRVKGRVLSVCRCYGKDIDTTGGFWSSGGSPHLRHTLEDAEELLPNSSLFRITEE